MQHALNPAQINRVQIKGDAEREMEVIVPDVSVVDIVPVVPVIEVSVVDIVELVLDIPVSVAVAPVSVALVVCSCLQA